MPAVSRDAASRPNGVTPNRINVVSKRMVRIPFLMVDKFGDMVRANRNLANVAVRGVYQPPSD